MSSTEDYGHLAAGFVIDAGVPLPGPHPSVPTHCRHAIAGVVWALVNGATPEEIADHLDRRDLPDVARACDRAEMLDHADIVASLIHGDPRP